ncbi:MAG: hypothetical protein WBF16_05490 [Candidatus Deferrimicrobiaceae bacterium]|jgi:hypothetical protein
MHSRIRTTIYLLVSLLLLLLFAPLPGYGDSDKNGGSQPVDLVLRKVTVTPVRVHVGDVVRVEMEWDYWGDIFAENRYDTNMAAVRANGKVVASKTYTADFGGLSPGDTCRETFLWNTTGMAPGEYRIRGEVPVIQDKTHYDNYLDVKEPLLLVPAGVSFPDGKERGGEAVAESPY